MHKRNSPIKIVMLTFISVLLIICNCYAESPEKEALKNGIDYFRGGKYDEAIAELDKAIKLNANFGEAYHTRGCVYVEKGDFEKSIDDFDKALEVNPHNARAYYDRGIAYGKLENYDHAIRDFNKAIEIDPKYADAYANCSEAYYAKGDLEKAIEASDKAIKINPDHAFSYLAYNIRGAAYAKKNWDLSHALSDFNKSIKRNPNFAAAYKNRATLYLLESNFDKAIFDCNKAMQIDPKDADAYNDRGFAYSKKGRMDEAISDYTKAIELDPKNKYAYVNRADVYLKKKDYDKSWADVNKAKSLDINVNPALIKELTVVSGKSPSPPSSGASSQEPIFVKKKIGSMEYEVLLPADFEKRDKNTKYALIVVLQGDETKIEWITDCWRESRVTDNGYIIACPQIAFRKGDEYIDVFDKIDLVLFALKTTYPIDLNNLYLTGFSNGGEAAIYYGVADPKKFRAIAAVGAWLRDILDYQGYDKRNIKELRLYVLSGKEDPWSNFDNMVSTLKNYGATVSSELINGGHEYKTDHVLKTLNYFNGIREGKPASAKSQGK